MLSANYSYTNDNIDFDVYFYDPITKENILIAGDNVELYAAKGYNIGYTVPAASFIDQMGWFSYFYFGIDENGEDCYILYVANNKTLSKTEDFHSYVDYTDTAVNFEYYPSSGDDLIYKFKSYDGKSWELVGTGKAWKEDLTEASKLGHFPVVFKKLSDRNYDVTEFSLP